MNFELTNVGTHHLDNGLQWFLTYKYKFRSAQKYIFKYD